MTRETKIKLFKTLRGALIAGSGVAVTHILQALMQMDFGGYTAMIAGVAAVLVNAVREALKNYGN